MLTTMSDATESDRTRYFAIALTLLSILVIAAAVFGGVIVASEMQGLAEAR